MAKLTPEEIKKATDILSAWTALEILSPQKFKKEEDFTHGNVKDIHIINQQERLPWEEKATTKDRKLFYQIVLGTIDYKKAIDLLAKTHSASGKKEYKTPKNQSEQALIAVLTVDHEGRIIQKESQGIRISAFAWGVVQILDNNLKKLADWPTAAEELKKIKKDILNILQAKDKEGNPLPLTFASIHQAYLDLTQALGLDKLKTEITIDKKFTIKCYSASQYAIPNPIIRSSFFVDDLEKAKQLINKHTIPETLLRYLGLRNPENKNDVFNNTSILEDVLAPNNIPLAKWPSPIGSDLVLLQQAAVNIAMSKLNDHDILGINGPPGTGKTTLLRDIMAAIVNNRAEKMVEFDNPETAFIQLGKPIKVSDSTFDLYSLDTSLKGFEILIASSNNKAAENISAALPEKNTIDPTINLNYFKVIADALLGKGDKTWGLISAVLGNSANIKAFYEQFKNNEDASLDNYLLATIEGARATVQDIDPSTGKPTGKYRLPYILTEDKGAPTSIKQAREKWEETKEAFKKISSDTKKKLDALQQIRNKVHALDQLQSDKSFFSTKTQSPVENPINTPNYLFRVLGTPSAHDWKQEEERRSKWEILHKEIKHLVQELQGVIISDHFFEGENRAKQMTTPWLDQQIQSLRGNLFVAAMSVHKAFMTAAAKPMRNNLNLFMEVLAKKGVSYLKGIPKEHMAELWASFFLVVPAVSTTFASVERMLEDIGPNTLGWLLIDEAGQATPQSAVGAIMRSKKVIVTGDPLQIKPIVELPDKLIKAICKEFEVDETHFNPHHASVQTLADEASSYYAKFGIRNRGIRKVGVPLLVHRRCANLMFNISNAISYGNLMVYGKKDKPSKIKGCLGDSQWFNIVVENSDKQYWVPEEGAKVIELLNSLKEQHISPDLLIISPFGKVVTELRGLIKSNKNIHHWLSPNVDSWLQENVETIYNIQGREQEAVILVLGGQYLGLEKTRSLISEEPNLLNVAVTRAKEVPYVVGNSEVWVECGVFGIFKEVFEELNKRIKN